MLTKIATITRACSASSRMSRTQPVTVSLRHMSSRATPRGSMAPRSRQTRRQSRGLARSERPCAAPCGSPKAAPRTARGCPQATGQALWRQPHAARLLHVADERV
eukprot:4707817-Prymnesium_polylepis.1